MVFGILWITISGEIAVYLNNGSDLTPKIELYKGIFFILATSLMLYLAINRRERQREILESEIAASEEKWKTTFESANDPIFVLDKNYNIIEANSKAQSLYGYTEAEFKSMNIKDLDQAGSIDAIKRQMERVTESAGTEYEVTHKKKEGSFFPAEVSTRAVVRNNKLEFIHIVHDLTARKIIIDKLKESESKYRTLVETSHELIWSTDKNNYITFVNNASKKIYGLDPQEMIGRKFTDFATEEQITEDKKAIEEAKKNGENFIQYESRITDAKGNEKWLLTNSVISKDPEGNISGMMGTSLDITERVEAEERSKYHNRVYSLLTNINQLIVRAKDREQILKDACRLTVEYGMFQLAWIGIVDKSNGKVIPEYYFGDSTDYISTINVSIDEKENVRGPIVRSFKEKSYYVSNDIENDIELMKWRDHTIEKGFRSFATFPIEVQNNVVAVYNIYSRDKDFFGKKETELLLEMTEDISFALEYLELENERHIIEERYRNIVELAPIGIFAQLGNVITYINPEGYKMLGASSYKEIIGKDLNDIIHPDFRNIVSQRRIMLENGQPASELEEKFLKINGDVLDVMVSAIPYQHEGKKGAQVFFRDLTEQKKTQKEINDTNERFKLITKATNDALWDWNLETNEIWWNEGFKDLFGDNDDEIEKGIESWMNRIAEADRNRIKTGIFNAIKLKHDFWFDEYSFLKIDGTYAYVFVRGYILKNNTGKPYRMVGSMIDISFRRKMEEDLKSSEEKWRSLFEYTPSIIFTIDKNYKITNINRSLSKRFDVVEIIGKSGFELIHKDEYDRVKKIIDGVFSSKEASSFTVRSNDPDDQQSYFTVQAVPVIKKNITEGITLIATDITEKILAEEKIRETNESLHALAAHLQTVREEERTMISREIHDQLGQELTALKMDIAFLSKKINKAKTDPDWDEIQDGLRSMTEITDQTINSVRRIARELRPDILDKLGLREAIEWQAEEFTKRTGIDAIVSISPGEFEFDMGLNTTIFRIVQESLTNVARHSGATRSKIGLILDQKNIYLSIEDNGRGITEDEIENAKSLGLVGIKERVYSVNGKLSITGNENRGTKLQIIIPLIS